MSVAYVENHPAVVTVADEIESFFHVLLFYAVRLLNHNIELVPAFIVAYFDSHAPKKARGQRACSDLKTSTMKAGELTYNGNMVHFYTDPSCKTIHTTFEQLLDMLIGCFKARYEVAKWSKYVKAIKRSRSASPKDGRADDDNPYRRKPKRAPRPPELVAGQAKSRMKEPSNATKSMAARLHDHTQILDAVWYYLDAAMPEDGSPGYDWPVSDAITDRLFNSGYDPRPHILALGELQKNIEAHTSTHVDGPPPLKKIKTSASGSIEPQPQLIVQRSIDSDSNRPLQKRRSRKGKSRA
ncbi:hypothetical protein C8Q78DRAFT_391508 [Trametes maxima]|nr:hypothetical protein C8Q78DRAFT_391508 [Trametes maxima]